MLKILPLIMLFVVVVIGVSFADNIVIHNIGPGSKTDVKMDGHRLQAEAVGTDVVVSLDGKEIWRGKGNHELQARSTEKEIVVKIDGQKVWPK